MAQKEFWIDYSDPPYPGIRHKSHPGYDSRWTDLMTLTQCRREIKEHARQHRQHWLTIMKLQLGRSEEQIRRNL